MSSFVNFSSLQNLSVVGSLDRLLININGLSGVSGFGRSTTQSFEKSLGVYSTVQANSASWGTDSGVRTLTANWQNTYTTFSGQSASNASVYSTVQSNSSTWGSGGGSLPAGGTVNQILIKNSDTAGDASWKNKRTTLTLATASGASATISCNALSADQFVVSLSGLALSATFAAPISAYDAQIIMWNVRYTTNIARVLLASSFRTPATTLNWSISTNKMDIFAAKYNALDSKWDVISFAPGYSL